MIRVLHVVSSMNRGGLETQLINIYRKMDKTKIQFDFLKTSKGEDAYDKEINELGGKIFTVPSRRESIDRSKKALNDFFKCHTEYKIVHQHVSSLSNIDVLKIAKKKKIPVRIIHSRSSRPGSSKKNFIFLHKFMHRINQRKISEYATDYFACSELAAKWLYGRTKIYKEKKYKIIKNGIDSEKFKYNTKKREEIRKVFNMGNDFVIGHVGRFHPVKNHTFLIDVFYEYNKKNPNSRLVLIGDGPLKETIIRKVKSLKISEKVIFTGIRNDVEELLQGIDFFLLPSLYEGLPGVVVEAQCSGLPCLISKTITKEVQITKDLKYEDLEKGPVSWAKEIENMALEKKRENKSHLVKEAGFDMIDITKEISEFYIERINDIIC